MISNGLSGTRIDNKFQNITGRSLNQQRFGRQTDGCFVVEWLEMNYEQFYFIRWRGFWRSNEIQGHEMREYQDALITHVFGDSHKDDFLPKVKSSLNVMTWDGKDRIMLEATYIEKMFKEVLLSGPLAAMYGREIEQILIQNHMPELVSEADFDFSVRQGRTSIKKLPLRAMKADDSYEEEDRYAEDECR